MKQNILFIACLALLLAACFEDKGNYDYKEIGTVNVEGIDAIYTRVSMQDTLRVAPVITSDKPGDTFACTWLLQPSSITARIMEADTIGTDLVLDYPVNLRPGTRSLSLVATNLNSGGKTYLDFELRVTTRFSVGLYLLKEMGAYSELDLHLPDGDVMSDLLEKSLGERVTGKPVSLGVGVNYSYVNLATMTNERQHALTICTDEAVKMLCVEDLGLIYEKEQMFMGDVPSPIPYYLSTTVSYFTYISREGIYGVLGGSGRFGYPVDIAGNCMPNPRSLIVGPLLFFFDDLNGRFISVSTTSDLRAFNDLGAGGTVMTDTPNNIPHEMLYFGHNFTGQIAHEGYAIFQDKLVTGKRYLYRLALSTSLNNPITSVVEIPSSLKFNETTSFATSERDGRLIYFLHDNNLYLYDVEQGTEELLAPTDLPPGEEITYFSNRYYLNAADLPANFNYLAIATHAAGKYKVYLYETLGGKPLGAAKRVLEGDGKVRKMQYMTNLLVANATGLNFIPFSI
jgi:hypothetical protein